MHYSADNIVLLLLCVVGRSFGPSALMDSWCGCVCMCVRACVFTCMFERTCVCSCRCVCLRVYMGACVCSCVRACVRLLQLLCVWVGYPIAPPSELCKRSHPQQYM